MSDFHEEFAPEVMTDSDETLTRNAKRTRRYATRSKNVDADALFVDNLRQIREMKPSSDIAESQFHYAKLDLANKELEIIELKKRVAELELIEQSIQNYNKSFTTIQKNLVNYVSLTKCVGKTGLSQMLADERFLIVNHCEPDLTKGLPSHVSELLLNKYKSLNNCEVDARNDFHSQLMWDHMKKYVPNMLMLLRVCFVILVMVLLWRWL
jgi:hypothetical protein